MQHIVVNPAAGNGRAKKNALQIATYLQKKGIEHEIIYTQRSGHASVLCSELAASGVERILCLGGDGTILESAGGLLGTNTALGILPGGTGNDFARCLGIPSNPIRALDLLMQAPVLPVNVASVNGRPFINVCGAGFDVQVVIASRSFRFLTRGMLPYLLGVIKTLIRNASYDMEVTVDGETLRQKTLLCDVANGQYIGGGMRIAPTGDPTDDLLDIVLVDALPRREILRKIPLMIVGKHLRFTDIIHHKRCREVTIRCPGMQLQCDGELLEPCDEAHFTLLPRHLNMLCPGTIDVLPMNASL